MVNNSNEVGVPFSALHPGRRKAIAYPSLCALEGSEIPVSCSQSAGAVYQESIILKGLKFP